MDSDVWTNLAFTWAPILLMIGFWLFFMRRLGAGRGNYLRRNLEVLERQERVLERIAIALERSNARRE